LFEDDYSYYFVSEYLGGGDLWDAVHGLFGGFGGYTEETSANVIKQLLQAVNYLHKKGIVHRNIRSGNILFTERGKADIKLIDFDVAGTKTMEAASIYGGGLHGPFYCAPEIFKNEYSEKVDLWSIGVVLYFMLVGSLPFDGATNEEVIQNIKRGQMIH
jgi:serine/threonine protein kinase